MSFAAYLTLLRPKQWTKNLFCFAGVIFSGKASEMGSLFHASTGFAAFCMISSFVYSINDIVDRRKDAFHPRKRSRPIASGAISLAEALGVAFVCLAFGIALGSSIGLSVLATLIVYAGMQLCYIWFLKGFVVLDVMVIATGFILRIFVGTEAVGVPATAWIILCTFFLALFLGFGKRRAEMNVMGAEAESSRHVLQDYTIVMLDRFANICATLAIATYALFTMSPQHERTLVFTCPPVVFGMLRYLFLIEKEHEGEAPDSIILKDRPIQAALALWLLLYISITYFGLRVSLE